jgi:hypothetical protein
VKRFSLLLLLLLFSSSGIVFSQGKAKKNPPQLPAAFRTATYFYVECMDGGPFKPGLLPEDRQAISDVQNEIQDWGRYKLAVERHDADLVFVVRKGRIASVSGHGGVSVGTNRPQSTTPTPANPGDASQTSSADSTTVGMRTEAGPPNDLLWVYMVKPNGSLLGPIWQNTVKDGLDAPDIPLLKDLIEQIDTTYPLPPPKPAAAPAQHP